MLYCAVGAHLLRSAFAASPSPNSRSVRAGGALASIFGSTTRCASSILGGRPLVFSSRSEPENRQQDAGLRGVRIKWVTHPWICLRLMSVPAVVVEAVMLMIVDNGIWNGSTHGKSCHQLDIYAV